MAPEGIRSLLSRKRDLLFISLLFLINSYLFSDAFDELKVNGPAANPWLLLIMLYGLAGVLPLAWRDKAPLTVFVMLCAHVVVGWPILPQYAPVLGITVALYAVSLHYGMKTSLLALLAAFIPGFFDASTPLRTDPDMPVPELVGVIISNSVIIVVLFFGAWSLGRLTRASQQHIQRLERERATAREAVAAERRRIARELHDIVSHAVTVIVLQAAGAARVAETNFAQVTQSLAHIEATGKQAMTELRRLLGVLEASDPARHATGDLGPQPGLVDLAALVSSLRATGMRLSVDVEGTPHPLDPSVDLAAYRIVQEGLTNVLKHAGKNADPRLRLIWEAHNLLIQLDNDTNPTEARRGQALSVGRGLVGLRERAHAVGGHLHAGPRPKKDGYRLTATLPLADTAQRTPHPPPAAMPAAGPGRGDQGKVLT